MARTKPMMAVPMNGAEQLDYECIPCLEDEGLWDFAAKVRCGERVWLWQVNVAFAEAGEKYGFYSPLHSPFPGTLRPVRDSLGIESLNSMMSEWCPPNTGRDYEEV